MINPVVVSLDAALRMTRGNTLWSSSYVAKADRLGPLQRRRLLILEERLFVANSGLKSCEIGQLRKPEGHFVCADGEIWYFFSKPKRKFVLLDFALGGGGSGGLPVPTRSAGEPRMIRYLCGSQNGPQRWVAYNTAGVRGLAHLAFRIIQLLAFRIMKLFRTMFDRMIGSTNFANDQYCELVQLHLNRRAKFTCLFDGNRNNSGLPEWSILAPLVAAPEQLHNQYARSILTGEKLCRMVTHTAFGRALLTEQVKHRSVDLLREATYAIDTIFVGGRSPHAELKTLEITKALQKEVFLDDRLLSVARGELTAHLSVFITRNVTMSLLSASDDRTAPPYVKLRNAMKKYALLADFISISEHLLQTDRPRLDIEAICQDYRGELKGWQMTSALRDIGAFDCSIAILVADLTAEPDRYFDSAEDLADLHRRLLDVTNELFDP